MDLTTRATKCASRDMPRKSHFYSLLKPDRNLKKLAERGGSGDKAPLSLTT